MRRPAFAEIDLDRVDLPFVLLVADDDEVEREAADDAFLREAAADFERLAHDRRRVLRAGGEAAPEIRLAARAAEHLVVRRERFDFAERCDAQLRARAAKVAAGNPLFDDAAVLAKLAGESL